MCSSDCRGADTPSRSSCTRTRTGTPVNRPNHNRPRPNPVPAPTHMHTQADDAQHTHTQSDDASSSTHGVCTRRQAAGRCSAQLDTGTRTQTRDGSST
jgi:hypothetical protein